MRKFLLVVLINQKEGAGTVEKGSLSNFTLCCNAVSLSCMCVSSSSTFSLSLVNQIQWYLYIVTVYGNSSRHIFSQLRPKCNYGNSFPSFFFYKQSFNEETKNFLCCCLPWTTTSFQLTAIGKKWREKSTQFSFVCLLSWWVIIIHFQFLATDISWTIFFSFFFFVEHLWKVTFLSLSLASFFFFFFKLVVDY